MNNEIYNTEQIKQLEEMKKKILSGILTKEAYERLARVRTVNPTLAGQVEIYILQIYQTGKLKQPITDEKMKEMLKALSEERNFNIRRE